MIVLSLLVVVGCAVGKATSTGEKTAGTIITTYCVDSDGLGARSFKGKVISQQITPKGVIELEKNDLCLGTTDQQGNSQIKEYVCYKNKSIMETIDSCLPGTTCADGACSCVSSRACMYENGAVHGEPDSPLLSMVCSRGRCIPPANTCFKYPGGSSCESGKYCSGYSSVSNAFGLGESLRLCVECSTDVECSASNSAFNHVGVESSTFNKCVLGKCVCSSDCNDRQCGNDKCGNSCGKSCKAGQQCNAQGKCFSLTDNKDSDKDSIPNSMDNCLLIANTNQKNNDGDAFGDACDTDDDNDGILDTKDNCPLLANSEQFIAAFGVPCNPDDDNDGILDGRDNCPLVANTNQADTDKDAIGDVCDPEPCGYIGAHGEIIDGLFTCICDEGQINNDGDWWNGCEKPSNWG